ncbi:flavin reductase family protein [Thalassotalea euphylliae]|uniref:flavin reductase family protein n=1 Tax=Thalassotalea euphylliae TaxID=1655234 RepID=UPI00362A24A0
MIIDFDAFSASQRYHLMTQTIIPRPIAWALTSSTAKTGETTYNLAPFSYFTAVSSDPAVMMISVGKKPNGDFKDTLVNVKANKKMVIHIASENQADIVTQTAASLAHGESEIADVASSQLSTVEFDGFDLPRVEQCDIAYGCELYEIKELGDVPQSLIFVEIKKLYVNPDVATTSEDRIKVHADRVNPLARLGASEYSGITAPFKKARPA